MSTKQNEREIIIQEGVTIIRNYEFYASKKLKSVVLPGSVKRICADAFGSCTSLEEIIISEGITEIGKRAFSNCTRLERIIISSSTKLEMGVFIGCNALDISTLLNEDVKKNVIESFLKGETASSNIFSEY